MITKKGGKKEKVGERGENYIGEKIPQKKINYSEFLAATMDDQYYLQPDRLKKTFNYMDASETGTIS